MTDHHLKIIFIRLGIQPAFFSAGKIPHLWNLTVCHWEKLMYFNLRATCLWSYCYRRLETDDRYNISCLQSWYKTDSEVAGLGIKAATGFKEHNFSFKSKFQARMWNHFCVSWQLYKDTGEVRIFHNGENIGKETFTPKSLVNGIAGSEEVFESFFILGQEPDVIGPPYEKEDLFRGIITEVNVWDSVLDKNTISKLATCKHFLRGNVISWSKDQFNITKAKVKDLSDKKSLCAPEKKLVIFPERRDIEDSRVLCKAHGGKCLPLKPKKKMTI